MLTCAGLRIAAALGVLVVAGVVGLAAEDVRRWDDRLRTDDLRLRAQPGGAAWQQPEWLGAAAVRSILGIDDDLGFRRVVSGFASSARTQARRATRSRSCSGVRSSRVRCAGSSETIRTRFAARARRT